MTQPKTPEEQVAHELDRSEKYVQWYLACRKAGKFLFSIERGITRRTKCDRKTEICVPHISQWDFYYKCQRGSAEKRKKCEKQLLKSGRPDWRVSHNNVKCVSSVNF